MTTHYATLGVIESASDEQIRQAHRRLLKENRSDTNKIKVINTAFNILKNPDKRRAYDADLARAKPHHILNTNTSTTEDRRTESRSTSPKRQSEQSPPPLPPQQQKQKRQQSLPALPVARKDNLFWLLLIKRIGLIIILSVAVYFMANFLTLEEKVKNNAIENKQIETDLLSDLEIRVDTPVQKNNASNDYCTNSEHWIKLAGICYQVELALDKASQERGLGFRHNMPAEHGMLYVYGEQEMNIHVTKGMLFPIDILFFDNERRLVSQHHNVQPCSADNDACPSYSSNLPARYVLELNAGQSAQLNLKFDDELILGPNILLRILFSKK